MNIQYYKSMNIFITRFAIFEQLLEKFKHFLCTFAIFIVKASKV